MTPPTINIGTSRARYNHWQGISYSDALPKTEWLDFCSEVFPIVEINATFISLLSIDALNTWNLMTNKRLRFAVKFFRFGTHMKKLEDPEETKDHFLEGAAPLEDKLSPIPVQLPLSHPTGRSIRKGRRRSLNIFLTSISLLPSSAIGVGCVMMFSRFQKTRMLRSAHMT